MKVQRLLTGILRPFSVQMIKMLIIVTKIGLLHFYYINFALATDKGLRNMLIPFFWCIYSFYCISMFFNDGKMSICWTICVTRN